MSVDDYFAGRPPGDRSVFEAVLGCLAGLDSVIVEPVSIGILFKRRRTFAELRPRRVGLALNFGAPQRLNHDRIARTTRMAANSRRFWHGVNIVEPGDVDETVRDWLREAYEDAGLAD
jgi:hypothetical protein